ncbi:MAG: galactose mutarotase [Akkermansia sp.]|nr:galactose mutarotase [Akkermansia sp.]
MQPMHFGIHSQGEDIEVFSLSSSALQVRITNYGARLLSVVYGDTDVVHGPKTAAELEADTCYCGSICGRVANRIAGGTFELDGKQYALAVNNGPNHLHGGLCGFSDRVWRVEFADEAKLVLSLVSAAGEEGYPGTVRVRATYTLKGDTLSLKMEAETDSRTPLNLTNHVYWNLNGAGTVDDHMLQVLASAYTPMVANIPTGSIVPVAGTLYDLRTPACLGQRNAADAIAGGYDDNYVLPAYPGVKPAAVLSNGTLELTLATDAPGMQVYTGDYLPLKRGGVALEAQNYPDSLHNPHFPSIVLNPGEAYCRTICWQLRRVG